jgi:CheY-like chemotaxis protein
VLLDLGMPGMDGYAAASRIRSDPRHRALRLIAVTVGAGTATDSEQLPLASMTTGSSRWTSRGLSAPFAL